MGKEQQQKSTGLYTNKWIEASSNWTQSLLSLNREKEMATVGGKPVWHRFIEHKIL